MIIPLSVTDPITVLNYLGFNPLDAGHVPTGVEVIWPGADPVTVQDVIDANDSPGFATWYAEHGGDQVLTLRRKAKEALDDIQANEALIRALAFVVMDEINILRAQHSLADRTPAQLRTAIKNKITSGDADT